MVGAAVPVPLDVETDVLQATDIGKDAKGDFVDVLKNGEAGSFLFPIKKNKLKGIEISSKKATLTATQGKVVCNVLATFVTF